MFFTLVAQYRWKCPLGKAMIIRSLNLDVHQMKKESHHCTHIPAIVTVAWSAFCSVCLGAQSNHRCLKSLLKQCVCTIFCVYGFTLPLTFYLWQQIEVKEDVGVNEDRYLHFTFWPKSLNCGLQSSSILRTDSVEPRLFSEEESLDCLET